MTPLTLLLAGCAGGASEPAEATRNSAWPVGSIETSVHQPVQELDDYGPEFLLPDENTSDDVVATIAGRVLRKSHIYDRLLLVSPDASLEVVDLLVLDILVAEMAMAHDIRVDPAKVDGFAKAEEDRLQETIDVEFDGKLSFEEFVRSTFEMSVEEHRQLKRRQAARLFYLGYAIRYPAMLEDRVQVRFMANKDRQVLQDVVDRVSRGADFATLARRYSEDETTRRDGGLLTPFGAGFPHPITEPALRLQEGELSPIIEADVGSSVRYYLVYCLKRFDKRDVTFEEVREELDRDLVQHPVTRLEIEAFTLRYRPELESRIPREGRQ